MLFRSSHPASTIITPPPTPWSPQHIEETLRLHTSVREDTLEAGRRLSESMTEPRTQGQLQKQQQALQEAWLHTLGQLGKRRALVRTVLQVHAPPRPRRRNAPG